MATPQVSALLHIYVSKALQGQPLQPDERARLESMLTTCEGRRVLASVLERHKANGALPQRSFETMAYIVGLALDFCVRQDDFTLGLNLIDLAGSYYLRSASEGPSAPIAAGQRSEPWRRYSLTRALESPSRWSNMRFWSGACFECLLMRKTSLPGGSLDDGERWSELPESAQYEIAEREENAVFGVLSSLVQKMLQLGVPNDDVRSFVQKTAAMNEMKDENLSMIVQAMQDFENYRLLAETADPELLDERRAEVARRVQGILRARPGTVTNR